MSIRVSKWGLIYFTIVFAVGFVLGVLRVTLLEPILGIRWAELAEMPVMLIAIVGTARWLVRKTKYSAAEYVGIGILALILLIVVELSLAFGLRGVSIREYISSRDPVSGTVYFVMLGVFALMPLLLSRMLATGIKREPLSDPNLIAVSDCDMLDFLDSD